MPSALAIFAHPDDIEFVAAGTMLLLQERGWDLHYINLCTGNGGSVQMDGPTTTRKRLEEGKEAARILDAFLTTAFEGGRHERRVEKLEHLGTGAASNAALEQHVDVGHEHRQVQML